MSLTLRGRIESRLAAAFVPFAAACVIASALGAWWPVQLAGVMIGVGLALDAAAYHRLLPYQAGWLALPLGAVELAGTMGLALALDVNAPLRPALAFFAGSWALAQLLVHAGLPLLHLTYAEDGGELGRAGPLLLVGAPAALLATLGTAWVTQPPTVRLAAGVHEGPIVVDHAQRLVGEPGTIVRGGILVTADDVEISDLEVVGGERGIEIRGARDVVLERVRIRGARLDGISARQSAVTIRDCSVLAGGPLAQGIDISFSMHVAPSLVEGCFVTGGAEGIVSHLARIEVRDNVVAGTGLHAIAVTEMSMGAVEGNEVNGALGVGIFCGDYSHCAIRGNRVAGTRPDGTITSRQGYGIVAHYGARATLDGNANEDGAKAFIGASLAPD